LLGRIVLPHNPGWRGRHSATADRRANHEAGAYEHDVLNYVLAFECRCVWDPGKGQIREQKQRSDCPQHLHPQEEKRRSQEEAEDQAQANEGFPDSEDEERDLRWDQTKAQGVNGLRREVVCGAKTGEELQQSEPEEYYAQADTEEPHAVIRHPLREGGIDAVEGYFDGVHWPALRSQGYSMDLIALRPNGLELSGPAKLLSTESRVLVGSAAANCYPAYSREEAPSLPFYAFRSRSRPEAID